MSSSTCVGSSDSMSKQASQIEKRDSTTSSGLPIQLDHQGLPLVPQPSRFTDDPLVGFYEPCIPICIASLTVDRRRTGLHGSSGQSSSRLASWPSSVRTTRRSSTRLWCCSARASASTPKRLLTAQPLQLSWAGSRPFCGHPWPIITAGGQSPCALSCSPSAAASARDYRQISAHYLGREHFAGLASEV